MIPYEQLALIQDSAVREALLRFREEILSDPFRKGQFRFFEVQFEGAEANRRIRHGLGFLPLDVIVTHQSGAASPTINYLRFTNEFLDISAAGQCRLRFFAGSYREEQT